MKISDYEKVTTLGGGDKFLVDKPEIGTKTIEAADMLRALKETIGDIEYGQLLKNFSDSPNHWCDGTETLLMIQENKLFTSSMRWFFNDLVGFCPNGVEANSFFRGAFLGSVFTDDQKATIQDNSFHGICLGDRWSIGGHTYYVAGFNTYEGIVGNAYSSNKRNSNDRVLPRHLVIFCNFGNMMDYVDTNPSTLYKDSYLKTQFKPGGKYYELIKADFGEDWIVPHYEVFPSAEADDGHMTSATEEISLIDLPTMDHFGYTDDYFGQSSLKGSHRNAMPLFRFSANFSTQYMYTDHWTRTKHSKTSYFTANGNFGFNAMDASAKEYVNPYFLLGKFKE